MNLKRIKLHTVPDNEINTRLKELYSKIPGMVGDTIDEYNLDPNSKHRITNPFLLVASVHYFNAPKKIMVIGQETFTWFGEINQGAYLKDNIPELLPSLYDLFINIDKGYNSPIWKLYREFMDLQPEYGFIANNVAKFGYVEETGFHRQLNLSTKQLLREEIAICKPDLLLFMCGPKYDEHIKDRLPVENMSSCVTCLSPRKICKIEFSDKTLPPALRTYHPAFLQRSRKRFNWVNEIYDFLFGTIRNI